MTINKIGIVGNGFVGNAVAQAVSKEYSVSIYDVLPDKSSHTLEQIWECDLIFICLPTPMKVAEGGECDLTILEAFFKKIPNDLKSVIAVKSTVPIGTTQRLQREREDLRIVHNPEFLTALNAVEDFAKSTRNIIGSDSYQVTDDLINFFKRIQPYAITQIVNSRESEMIKYFANSFLAVKVAYFNLLYDTCKTFECEYDKVAYCITLDERIGKSHTNVPGQDGHRGFGGTCFPKDINTLIYTLKHNNLEFSFLTNIWEYNKFIREDWDWSRNSSATSQKIGTSNEDR